MATANSRTRDYETVHHLGSRIAHKVFFFEENERNDFMEMARRVADFCGIQLIGWCVMTNHFHLLVYLPTPVDIDEAEILRRYGVLKGTAAATIAGKSLDAYRSQGEGGDTQIRLWLDSQRKRMYDISTFMKILKQWFTEEYNRRHSHTGTLWESRYFDHPVRCSTKDIADCLAYIHLNPIRAAITDSFDGYQWSSYYAFKRRDPLAIAGMRFTYGEDVSEDEMAYRHEELMGSLLETEKLRRATEIAQKRAAGYTMPIDNLTSEAMVAQVERQIEEMRQASMALREMRSATTSARQRHAALKEEVAMAIKLHPDFDFNQLMDLLQIPRSTLYRTLKELRF